MRKSQKSKGQRRGHFTKSPAHLFSCSPAHVRAPGLTLVEILAVLVILGLLAGTLVVGLSGSMAKARHELAKSGIAAIVSKLELYQIDHGSFPSLDLGLTALSTGQASPTDPCYLSPDQLKDPWNFPYAYIVPGPDGHPYEVICYGADHAPGGEGENRDVSSISLRDEEKKP
jgi:general secretion pathway protein G